MEKNVSLYNMAQELGRAIVDHEIFLKYREAKQKMEAQPDLRERLDRLRALQAELEQEGAPWPEDKARLVQEEFAQMENRVEIVEFLSAEKSLIQLVNNIQEIIQKVINSSI